MLTFSTAKGLILTMIAAVPRVRYGDAARASSDTSRMKELVPIMLGIPFFRRDRKLYISSISKFGFHGEHEAY